MAIWITADDEELEISKMEDSHLINAINYCKRRAKEGVMIGGGDFFDPESYWCETVYDEEALDEFDSYHDLVEEFNNRNL